MYYIAVCMYYIADRKAQGTTDSANVIATDIRGGLGFLLIGDIPKTVLDTHTYRHSGISRNESYYHTHNYKDTGIRCILTQTFRQKYTTAHTLTNMNAMHMSQTMTYTNASTHNHEKKKQVAYCHIALNVIKRHSPCLLNLHII